MSSHSDNTPHNSGSKALDEGKKTEMIELRISYDAKQALQARAAEEKRSVSTLVRHLIYDYLTPQMETAPMSKFSNLTRLFKGWKPKALAASAIASLAALISVYPAAVAEEVALKIDGDITTQLENAVIRSRRIQSTVHIGYDETARISIGEGDNASIDFDMVVRDIPDVKGEDGNLIQIEFKLWDTSGEDSVLVASPKLSVFLDQDARIEIGSEGLNGAKKYAFSITPRALN